MTLYSERRHRLNPDEIKPVRDAALLRLLGLLEARDPGALEEAGSLYRIWYRIETHATHKPAYPPHGTWSELAQQLPNGTIRAGFAPRGAQEGQETFEETEEQKEWARDYAEEMSHEPPEEVYTMPKFLVENRTVRTIIRARDGPTAVERFRARYPVVDKDLSASVVRWFGPPYLASPRGELGGGQR